MNHRQFWAENPAVLLGISVLAGYASSLFGFSPAIALLWIGYCCFVRKWFGAIVVPIAAVYGWTLCGSAPLLPAPLDCSISFHPISLERHQSPFYSDLKMRGYAEWEEKTLPCSLFFKEERPLADRSYAMTGTLKQKGPGDYRFQPSTWEPIPHTHSLAELRFQAKERVRRFLHQHLPDDSSAALLSSLITGDVEERLLRYQFGRLGLQHLLAISGFHFGLLLSFLSLLLQQVFSLRTKWTILFVVATLYCLFVGSAPAVQRAWGIASLYLLAKFLRRPASPINLLGAALLLELIFSPLCARSLGFQLSFAACFGILLAYGPAERVLRRFLPRRSAEERRLFSPALQCALVFLGGLRSSLALSIAVNSTALPLVLFHFGNFPLCSLLYNLFFPFLIGTLLFLLLSFSLIGLLLPFLIPPLFRFCSAGTQGALALIAYPPLPLDLSLRVGPFSPLWIAAYLIAFFFITIRTRTD